MTNQAWMAFAMYAVGLLALAMFGGWAAKRLAIAHTLLQMLLSLVGGLLLGVACLHLLPHALEDGQVSYLWVGAAFLTGIAAVYLTLRFLDGHADHGAHGHGHDHESNGRRGVLLAFAGFGVHGVLDGLTVAAAVAGNVAAAWPGLAAVVAVAMHKPMDTFMAGLLLRSRQGHRGWLVPTLILSLTTPLSAVIALLLIPAAIDTGSALTSLLMAFGAGVLLCVALADVLPEVKFHGHDRFKLGACLLVGIMVAAGLSVLESGTHAHDHAGHDHAEHAHPH